MQFSKKGFVDIVINIYNKGKKVPYIFFEIKSYRYGIDDGKKQLVSYMQTNDTVRYGVVTDGFDFEVIMKEPRDGDASTLVADNSKILRLTNWKPKYEDLEIICQSALNWENKC